MQFRSKFGLFTSFYGIEGIQSSANPQNAIYVRSNLLRLKINENAKWGFRCEMNESDNLQ